MAATTKEPSPPRWKNKGLRTPVASASSVFSFVVRVPGSFVLWTATCRMSSADRSTSSFMSAEEMPRTAGPIVSPEVWIIMERLDPSASSGSSDWQKVSLAIIYSQESAAMTTQ